VPVRFWSIIEARVAEAWKKYIAGDPILGLVFDNKAPGVTHDAVRRTAFFLARDIYQHRARERVMASPGFERFTGRNTAHIVRRVVADGGWLRMTRGAVQGSRSRRFELRGDLWPPRRGEPVFFLPP
jgi:hypothetical protein